MKNMKRMVFALSASMALLTICSCWNADEELEATPSREYLRTSDVVVAGDATKGSIHVDANCGWTIVTKSAWLSLSAGSGEGNGDVTFTMTVNPSSVEERTATVTLKSAGGITTTLTVRQERDKEQLFVIPDELEFFADETGYQEFTVTSNSSWTIMSIPEWVTLSITQGTGTGSVRVTVDENTSEDSRTPAVLIVTGSGGTSATVTVRQSGRSALLTASPLNIMAAAPTGTYTFTITGNVGWQVSVSDNWITSLSADSGRDKQDITFICRDNMLLSSRTGSIVVLSENQRQRVEITVTQLAAELPVVGMLFMVELDEEQATLQSSVTSMFPVTEYGVCYGETTDPTTKGLKVVSGRETPVEEIFLATIAGLTKGNTYHARAYAISAVGTAYGPDLEFEALARPNNDDNDRPQFARNK